MRPDWELRRKRTFEAPASSRAATVGESYSRALMLDMSDIPMPDLQVELIVMNEEERLELYRRLAEHPAIKMVL